MKLPEWLKHHRRREREAREQEQAEQAEQRIRFAAGYDSIAELASGRYRTMGEAFQVAYDALDAGYRAAGIPVEPVIHFSRTASRQHVIDEYTVEGKINATHEWLEVTCPICLTGKRRAKTG